MIKEKITLDNIVLGILLIILVISMSLFSIGPIIYLEDVVINKSKFDISLFLASIIASITGILFNKGAIKYIYKNLLPYRYSVRVIKKYINLNELKQILKNEKFEKIHLDIFKKDYDRYDFYASQNWLYINKLYIPKAMILCIYENNVRPGTIYCSIKLLNGKEELFFTHHAIDVKLFTEKLRTTNIIPNLKIFNLETASYSDYKNYEHYVNNFLQNIKTKKDFLNLVKTNYYH